MRYSSLLTICVFTVFAIAAAITSDAGTIGPIGTLKPPVPSDPCISANLIFYVNNRVTSNVGGDSKAAIFLDSWTLSINDSAWGNLYQHEDNYPSVAITRDTILSTDGSLIAYGTSVFTDVSTFEGAHGFFTSVLTNGNPLDLNGTYVWSYDFWNFQHTGELRLCVFLRQ